MRGLADARRALDARLSTASRAPLAVAFSGGGDSTALLLLAADWAAAADRPLLALTVDHGLNPASAAWTEHCRRLAERLGAGFQVLSWTEAKPRTGLPAAARAARHKLLADAARRSGARVILMGHTADDLAEAAAMRAEGSSTPSPEAWRPSPAWPEGRGVFILRPLLATRRADLRDWLASLGESWIDDPANEDVRFARARARALLRGAAPPEAAPRPIPAALAQLAVVNVAGEIDLRRQALREAAPDVRSAFVAAAALCAAGGASPPKPDRTARLAEALAGADEGVHTLAGARVLADADRVVFAREPGEVARGGLARMPLRQGETSIWDGRFEVLAGRADLAIRPMAGVASRLAWDEQARVRALQARVRGALPVLEVGEVLRCPLAQSALDLRISALAADRLAAACGLIQREPD